MTVSIIPSEEQGQEQKQQPLQEASTTESEMPIGWTLPKVRSLFNQPVATDPKDWG